MYRELEFNEIPAAVVAGMRVLVVTSDMHRAAILLKKLYELEPKLTIKQKESMACCGIGAAHVVARDDQGMGMTYHYYWGSPSPIMARRVRL